MKYYIRLPEPERIRELDSPFAFSAQSAQGIAEELRKALAEPDYIQRWRQSLDPDDAETLEPELLAVEAGTRVSAEQKDLHIEMVVETGLNGAAFKHRLRMLAGPHWQLWDVR